MVEQRTIATAGLAAAGAGLAATTVASAQAGDDGVIDDFSSWSGENALGEYTGAGGLANGDGAGDLEDDGLRLEYEGQGWFLTNVRADLSEYEAIEIEVSGDDGGEEDAITLEVGETRDALASLASGSIDTATSTLTVDLDDVDDTEVQDIWLHFDPGESGAITLEGISAVGGGEDCEDGIEVGDNCAADLDDDDLYEDIDGSGDAGANDVVTFFEEFEGDAVQDNEDAFDFNGSGSVGFDDVIELFDLIN